MFSQAELALCGHVLVVFGAERVLSIKHGRASQP
jgi:hypothetical protein